MTADAAALRALAERLEQAKGPDRGLDGEIWIALFIPANKPGRIDHDGNGVVGWWPLGRPYVSAKPVPAYTSSLDAAVGLVPEGLSFGFTAPYRRDAVVSVFVPKSEKSEAQVWVPLERTVGRAAAATPALALTAASLRARAAMMEVA